MVVLVPVPVIPPGLIVHVPVAGRPLSTTLPVARAHVGCVIVPTTGAAGDAGCAFITMLDEAGEIHPVAAVTLKL